MPDEPKSGKEIVDHFFTQVAEFDGVNADVAGVLVKLHGQGKLTSINISNELSRIRGERLGDNPPKD